MIDLLAAVAAIVIPCTLLADYILETNIILLSIACLHFYKAPPALSPGTTVFPHNLSTWRRIIRTFVLVYTCVCIYAVDLPIFPRRFAKTEIAGVSLMDVGVGMVAITIGFSNIAFLDVCRSSPSRFNLLKIISKTTLPCLVVGALRTAIIKSLGYPDHVTEYGVHWNFFFTLACIRLGGFIVAYVLSSGSDFDVMKSHFALCVILACCHQWGILTWARSHHFLDADAAQNPVLRNSTIGIAALMHANAEGLVSLPGYLCLFVFGTAVALLLRLHLDLQAFRSADKLKILCVQGNQDWHGDPKKVSVAIAVLGVLALLIVFAFGEGAVSRRLVNLPYILLQMGLLSHTMAFFVICVFDKPGSKRKQPKRKDALPLITIISDNTMLYFLLSNLVTGILNLLFDTLSLAEWKPVWFAVMCQFLLLTAYTVVCPLLTLAFSCLLFKRKEIEAVK